MVFSTGKEMDPTVYLGSLYSRFLESRPYRQFRSTSPTDLFSDIHIIVTWSVHHILMSSTRLIQSECDEQTTNGFVMICFEIRTAYPFPPFFFASSTTPFNVTTFLSPSTMSSPSDSDQIFPIPTRPVRRDETDTSYSSSSEGYSEEWHPRVDDLAEERYQPNYEDQLQPSSSQPRPPPRLRAGAEPEQPPEAGSGDDDRTRRDPRRGSKRRYI